MSEDMFATIRLAIADGKLKPEEADLGREIIETRGLETFHCFLVARAVLAQELPRLPPLILKPNEPEREQ